jgi:hypothetical protein
MTRKTSKRGAPKVARKVSKTSSGSVAKERHFKEVMKDFITSPAVKYIAAGITTALLARIANNMSDRYPEISSFLKENLDTIEGKLSEFNTGSSVAGHSRH